MYTRQEHFIVKKLRIKAFKRQGSRCYYCNRLMWEGNPDSFIRDIVILPGEVEQRRCTAEHLRARKDGGQNTLCNIVAACLACNHGRHAGRSHTAPEPDAYRQEVLCKVAEQSCSLRGETLRLMAHRVRLPASGMHGSQGPTLT